MNEQYGRYNAHTAKMYTIEGDEARDGLTSRKRKKRRKRTKTRAKNTAGTKREQEGR